MDLEVPKHVAIILDGNRRFGERAFGDRLIGHEYGSYKIEDILDWCKDFNVKIITLWAFSTENFNRPKKEVKLLMDLFEKKFKEISEHPRIHRNKVRIQGYGRIDLFPERVQKALRKAEKATEKYDNLILNIAMGYGGRQEIIDVARKLAELVKKGELEPNQINEEKIEENFYVVGFPKPDLIIRTGGSVRTSGFMPWHGAYSEWYVSEKLWPEFNKHDFVKALVDYSDRKRNFGH